MGHSRQKSRLFLVICVTISLTEHAVLAISQAERRELREKVLEMFNHGFGSYMEHAYPADELMPLSCRGRHRGTKPSRGDIDDSLGNFSLTLVDSLDTLAVLGLLDQFDDAVRKVIRDVTFDRDIIVSVFETNIRVLGGLLGGHVMADYIKKKDNKHMQWYNNELLEKAKDLGYRLLPAFNTTTGMPYPRVNLRYGIHQEQSRAGRERDTCTACAGTMILEFAALSRLTGEPLFEARAHTALEYLWRSRHRSSNLVGTTINIHNGEWVRRESGVGAGIDSYYEYLLKAYILLGDDTYLERFNKHYEAINKYVMQGPLLVDVHMHRPLTNSRNFMDALLAFWPGLQVLKGDLKQAIETHEMLYQVTQRHNFLPEAFTTDFRVHWAQHPLRPEFVESTYFLFKATNDPHYLEVGRSVLQNLEKHARVPCGFAAIKDVTTGAHEDQMDSFVLAETFKYLYLLFSEKDEVMVDVDNYIFTTEAHLLPLTLSMQEAPELNFTKTFPKFNYAEDDTTYERSCRNTNEMFPGGFVENVRFPLKNLVENLCPKPKGRRKPRMRANSFIAGDTTQLQQLNKMGIKIVTMTDGRVQLLHTAADAGSPDDAEDGMLFMQEMIELSKSQAQEAQQEPRVVQLIGPPHNGKVVFNAGPAQFGLDLKVQPGVEGEVLIANPLRACQPLHNVDKVQGRIVVMERGDCMFVDKARNIQVAGALGGIIVDNVPDSSSFTAPLFAMSGDGKDDISIPLVFLFTKEYKELKHYIDATPALKVYLGYSELKGEPSSTTSQPAMSGAKLSGSSNSPPPPTPAEESFSMTYHTPAGQPLFTVSQDTAKKLRLTIDKTTIKEAGKARMATALEQVVQLIQTNPNFGKMNLKEQSDYLFTLGKLMEASFLSTDSQTDFEKKIMDILQERIPGNLENLGRSAATKPKDPAGHDFSGVLDEYINEQISKVFDEARSFLKTVEDVKPAMPEIELLRKEVEAKEEGKGSSLLDIPDTTTMDSPGGKELPSYASQEELSDTEGSQQQVIKKAPSWLKLGPGEVFITQEGVIYTNEGYDQEEEDGEDSGIEEEEEEMRERRQQITGVRYSKSMAEDYLNQVRNEQVESAKLTETGLRDLEPEILGGKTNQDDSLEDIEWESVSQPETNDALTSENRHNAAVIEDSSAASPETPGGDNKKKGNDEL